MKPSRTFITLYTLAFCGLFVSFMPFASVLMQVKVAAVAPQDRIALLGYAILGGAGVASIANIAWGWVSDITYHRTGTRRPWVAVGMGGLIAAFAVINRSTTPIGLLGAIAIWQVALNMMFAPLVAVLADEVPDDHKGRVSGLLGISHPVGVLSAAVVTLPFFAGEAARYAANCMLMVAMITPFLLFASERGGGSITTKLSATTLEAAPIARAPRGDLLRAWGARLAMQSAGNGLTAYAFFHFADLLRDPAGGDGAAPVAQGMAVVTAVAAAVTVIAGRLSDRVGGRKPFLAGATICVCGGLVGMALSDGFVAAIVAYGVVMAGMSVFLALHSALAMQLLPSPRTRGRDLGILNLTNTLPACIPPIIALVVATTGTGLAPIFIGLAVLAAIGGVAAISIRSER